MLRAEQVAYLSVFAWCAVVSIVRAAALDDRLVRSRWSLIVLIACAGCGFIGLGAAPGIAGAIGVAAVAVAAWTDAVCERIYHVLSLSALLFAIVARLEIDGDVVPSAIAGIALASFFLLWQRLRGTGGGDIGIGAVCGVAFGPIVAQEVLLIGAIVAVCIIALRMKTQRLSRHAFIPLAPFLLTGIIVLANIPARWRVT